MKKIMLSLVLCGLFISVPRSAKPIPTAVAIGGGIAAGVVVGLAAYVAMKIIDKHEVGAWKNLEEKQRAIAIAAVVTLAGVISGSVVIGLLWLVTPHGRKWRAKKKLDELFYHRLLVFFRSSQGTIDERYTKAVDEYYRLSSMRDDCDEIKQEVGDARELLSAALEEDSSIAITDLLGKCDTCVATVDGCLGVVVNHNDDTWYARQDINTALNNRLLVSFRSLQSTMPNDEARYDQVIDRACGDADPYPVPRAKDMCEKIDRSMSKVQERLNGVHAPHVLVTVTELLEKKRPLQNDGKRLCGSYF